MSHMTTGDSGSEPDELLLFYISSGQPAHDYQLNFFFVFGERGGRKEERIGGRGKEKGREERRAIRCIKVLSDRWMD